MPLLDANIPVPDFEAHRFDFRRNSAVSTSHDRWVSEDHSNGTILGSFKDVRHHRHAYPRTFVPEVFGPNPHLF